MVLLFSTLSSNYPILSYPGGCSLLFGVRLCARARLLALGLGWNWFSHHAYVEATEKDVSVLEETLRSTENIQ